MTSTDVATASAETAKQKRAKVTEKDYLGANNEVVKDIREATGVRIKVLGSGEDAKDYMLGDLNEKVVNGAAIFGLDVVLTNTIGGKDLTADEKFEAIQSRWETLVAGEWTSRKGEGGPRISYLATALFNLWSEFGWPAEAKEEERNLEGVTARVREMGEEGRATIAGNKRVKAEVERLKAEAAKARADKAAAEVGEDEEDLPGF